MKVSARNILKDRSNLNMSAIVAEFDTKMIDSKCRMTLRKKATVEENQSIGTYSKKVGSLKMAKKENTNSKESSNNIKQSVLTENNENQKFLSSPEVKNFVISVKKANSKDPSMEKQTPTLKRPRRGIKTIEDSSKENIGLGIVPPKPRKRKHKEENCETVLNVNKNKKSKGSDEKQISLPKFEQESKILSKYTEDSNFKGSDENLCCHKFNTQNGNLESINDVDSYLVKKPGNKSNKEEVARKKYKVVDKSIDLDASKSNSLERVKSVRIQAKKKNETSSESKTTNYSTEDKQTEAGFTGDAKFLKQKTTTLKRSKNTNVKCNSESKITNYFNTEVLSEKKAFSSKTPSVTIQSSGHIPIYKKVNKSVEPKRIKKYSRVSDVYNIEFDEDIKNSPPHLKKKPKKFTKSKSSKSRAVVSNPKSVKVLKKSKAATTSCAKTVKNITAQIQYNSASSPYQDNEDIMDVDPILPDSTQMAEDPPMHSQASNKKIQEKTSSDKGLTHVFEKEKLNKPASQTPEKQSKKLDAHFVLASSSPVPREREPAKFTSETPDQESNKGEKDMMTFLSDFEASFLRPQMSSTPDNTDPTLPVKKPVISKTHQAVRMLEICSIPAIKSVQEPNFVTVEFESPEEIDLSEITLFESPPKSEDKTKETSHQKKAGKKCRTKLNFGKSNKTVQKNESEKITSFLFSTHSNPETAPSSGESSHPKSPQRVLREKKKVVPQEVELSEDESDFEDDLFRSDSDNEDAREKEIVSNNPSKSPVKLLEVLKPRKSYSPSVKPCFSRTKKATLPVKQYVSKEEKLIQSMNEHFSELDSLELCIE